MFSVCVCGWVGVWLCKHVTVYAAAGNLSAWLHVSAGPGIFFLRLRFFFVF